MCVSATSHFQSNTYSSPAPVVSQLASHGSCTGCESCFSSGRLIEAVPLSSATPKLNDDANKKPGEQNEAAATTETNSENKTDEVKQKLDAAQMAARQKQEEAKLLQDQKMIHQLASRDREVRTHEQAHAAVGGAHAGAPIYEFTRGPDGKNYATGGHVNISVGKEETPAATIDKMQMVRTAALAPAEPSPEDRHVAATATKIESEARLELQVELREEQQAVKEKRTEKREEIAESQASGEGEESATPSAEKDSTTAENAENNDAKQTSATKQESQTNTISSQGQKLINALQNVFAKDVASSNIGFAITV